MKGKAIIPLLLGLGIGLVAVKFAVNTIKRAQAAGHTTETIKVVRAKQDISAYEEIAVEKVELVETVDNLFAPANDRIGALDDVVGRVSAKTILKGTAVWKSLLAPEGTRPGMVGRIPPGYRAVSVKINEVTGVAYQIKPDDWVDVIVVIDIDSSTRGKRETVAEVILQHVRVVAIGHATERGTNEPMSKVKPAKSATLLVAEADVPKLHLAATRGKITLAMPGEGEQTTATPASANMGDVLAGLGQPEPSEPQARSAPAIPVDWMQREPKPEPHDVLVYRGSTPGDAPTTVEWITFKNARSSKIIKVVTELPSRASSTIDDD